MKHLVFVYGSLKKGFGNQDFMESARFITETTTTGKHYKMISFGYFPGVLSTTKDGYHIRGELYEVDDDLLAYLDKLEDNGMFYKRTETDFASGERAWMYCLLYVPGNTKESNRIETKDGIQTWTLPTNGVSDFTD